MYVCSRFLGPLGGGCGTAPEDQIYSEKHLMARKWIVREGTKAKGFRYVGTNGERVTKASELERIDALRIPPAWRDVHISANPRAAIQVWGFDARGRKQYRYHQRAGEKGELRK